MKNNFIVLLGIILLTNMCYAQNENNTSKIDTTDIVGIGNIKQYITIKGNKNAPIILFLHGGPGRSLMNYSNQFTNQLTEHFVVIQWDQRKSGKTLELNATDIELSTKFLQEDTYRMIKYLLSRFNKEKIYLVSHSWSSYLGFYIADTYPELLYAYIPISPIINQEESTKLTVNMLKKWASKNNNITAINELNTINIPLKTKEDLFYQQKWLFIHNGVGFASESNFKAIYFEWMNVWFPLLIKSYQNNLFLTLPKIDCPIFLIEGCGDKQKSHFIVKKYYKRLKAKIKRFYWFKKSGHTVFNTEPEKLQQTILQIANSTNELYEK